MTFLLEMCGPIVLQQDALNFANRQNSSKTTSRSSLSVVASPKVI